MTSIVVDDTSGVVARDGKDARIIVLGAGLAGLRCAQDLVTKHGFETKQVVVLEASHRIGGRIKTNTSFIEGFSVDLGAELIHGDQTSLYSLAKENEWEMEEFISLAQGDGGPLPAESNDGFGLFFVGGEKRMLGMDSKDPGYVHLNAYLASLGGQWPSLKLQRNHSTISDHSTNASSTPQPSPNTSPPSESSRDSGPPSSTGAKPVARRKASPSLLDGLLGAGVKDPMLGIANAGYANTVGAALKDTGLCGMCFLESEWDVDGDRTFVLKGGLGLVVKELSTNIKSCIQTGWPAAKVDHSAPGFVTVTCRDGRKEQGTHVVCTLPLSVLQDGDVEFCPPLPEKKRKAFESMGMCSAVKVILKFDRPILPQLLHGCICSESFIPEFWFRNLRNIPEGAYTFLAVGFAAGPPADAISALNSEEALQKALAQLDDMFGGRAWLDCGGCTGKGDWENHPGPAKVYPPQSSSEYRSPSGAGVNGSAGEGENSAEPSEKVGASLAEPTELPSDSYIGGLVHDWTNSEPFVRGGYCYPRLEFDESTPADAASAVGDKIFFAGEHTNTPIGMTVHAAIDSGKRAAVEVVEALNSARETAPRNNGSVIETIDLLKSNLSVSRNVEKSASSDTSTLSASSSDESVVQVRARRAPGGTCGE